MFAAIGDESFKWLIPFSFFGSDEDDEEKKNSRHIHNYFADQKLLKVAQA